MDLNWLSDLRRERLRNHRAQTSRFPHKWEVTELGIGRRLLSGVRETWAHTHFAVSPLTSCLRLAGSPPSLSLCFLICEMGSTTQLALTSVV